LIRRSGTPGRAGAGSRVAVCATALLLLAAAPLGAQEPLRLYAAGSLRLSLTEVATAFTRASGVPVEATFGASGLLRERLERGERADVFASADVGHPRRLGIRRDDERGCARPHARSDHQARNLDARRGPGRRLRVGILRTHGFAAPPPR
jgi:hypothetical protein